MIARVASWFDVAGLGYQEFSAGGVRTFAIVDGRASGFPLVLLHTIPGASFVWSTTIQSLDRTRRVIAPDLPGWGRSRNRTMSETTRLTREGLRKWLGDVLKAQQCEQVDVVGLGVGAWLAVDYLLAHPGQVRRLGLLNFPIGRIAGVSRFPFWRGIDWDRKRLDKWLEAESAIPASVRDSSKPMFAELLSGGWHAERSPEFPIVEFRKSVPGYREALKRFDGEVLLGWGAKAAGYDETLAGEFAAGRSVTFWKDSANFPMWEQPEQYLAELLEFLR